MLVDVSPRQIHWNKHRKIAILRGKNNLFLIIQILNIHSQHWAFPNVHAITFSLLLLRFEFVLVIANSLNGCCEIGRKERDGLLIFFQLLSKFYFLTL